MAASDYAHYDREMKEYGYWTEDGAWHPISAEVQALDA